MHRVLRPGGTAIVTTWSAPQNQGLINLMRSSIVKVIPGFELPPFAASIPFTHPGGCSLAIG